MSRDEKRVSRDAGGVPLARRALGKPTYEPLEVETPRDEVARPVAANGSNANDVNNDEDDNATLSADDQEDDDAPRAHIAVAVPNGATSSPHTHAAGVPWTQVALVALSAISGFLFGYDLCVMVVALPQIHVAFQLSTSTAESVVSILMVGAVFGSLAGGVLADRIGRKGAIIVTSGFFLAGSLCMTFAPSIHVLLLGRFLAGLAVGSSGPCVSTYVAEIADPDHRGSLVTINEVMVCVGCLVSVAVSVSLQSSVDGWRKMLGVTLVPPLVQLAGMPFVPESPRWLITQKDRTQEARAVLRRLFPQQGTDDTDAQIRAQLAAKEGVTTSLWDALRHIASDAVTRRRVVLSVLVAVAHTATGANAMLYYSSYIIDSLGAGTVGGTTKSHFSGVSKELGVAVAKLAGVCTALLVIDRVGRRTLLLIGSMVMLFADMLFAWCFWGMATAFAHKDAGGLGTIVPEATASEASETLGIWTLYLFIYAWNLSWAPLMFVIGSEILPDDLRSVGMGLTFAVYWLGSSLVNQTLLTTFEVCGMSASFLLYGSFTAAAIAFIYAKVPETRGRSFEEITKFFSVTP